MDEKFSYFFMAFAYDIFESRFGTCFIVSSRSVKVFFCSFVADILFRDPDDCFFSASLCLALDSPTCFYFIISGFETNSGRKKKTLMKISGGCYRGFSVHPKA